VASAPPTVETPIAPSIRSSGFAELEEPETMAADFDEQKPIKTNSCTAIMTSEVVSASFATPKASIPVAIAIKTMERIFSKPIGPSLPPMKMSISSYGPGASVTLNIFVAPLSILRGLSISEQSNQLVVTAPVAKPQSMFLTFLPDLAMHIPTFPSDTGATGAHATSDSIAADPLATVLQAVSDMLALDTITTIVPKSGCSVFVQLYKDIMAAHERASSSSSKSEFSKDAPQMTEVTPPVSKLKPITTPAVLVVSPDTLTGRGSSESSSILITADESEVDARYARKCNTAQIGVATLREFFDELGSSPSSKCSKSAIVSAYMTLSRREHLELGEPTQNYPVAAVVKTRFLQFKVFLGNVKLADFLKMVKFDEQDFTSGSAVLRAFEECAKKDAELGVLTPALIAIGHEMGRTE
jgi:hypothetical protein